MNIARPLITVALLGCGVYFGSSFFVNKEEALIAAMLSAMVGMWAWALWRMSRHHN